MRLQADGVTDVGRRRSGNEDGLLVDDEFGLLAVADGMGGHQAGEVASATALESLRAAVASGMAMREAIEAANHAVLEKAAADPAYAGMGTTLTAGTLAADNTLVLGHVGDSRAYLLRDGELRRLTEDHSLVEEMVRDGRLTRAQAENHPQRSIITRALGVEPAVDVDVAPVTLQDGDRLLLCSDGLTTMVSEDAIGEILRSEPDAHRAAGRLVAAANAAGGEDNITAIVADFVPDREPVPTRTERRRGRPRRRLVRLALLVLPVVVVLGIAAGATAWYARSSYFVGFDGSEVTIFRGLPDGLLIWDPTVEARTDLTARDLTEAQRHDVEGGKRFSSLGAAEDYVDRLEQSARDRERREREQREQDRRQRERRRATTTTTGGGL